MSQKRKLWSQESMEAAVQSVQEGKGLWEASCLCSVPAETLRWRVTGKVELDCRPGPLTVLYNPRGKGRNCSLPNTNGWHGVLTKEAVMYMVGAYVTKCKRRTGYWWFQGFKARHPNLTVRMPQPLSYARAFNSTKEVVNSQHPCLEVGRNQQRLACSVQSSRNCMSNAIARGMMLQMRSMSPGCESCTLVMQTVEFVQAIHLLVNQVPLKLRLALSPISFKRCWFCREFNWKKEELWIVKVCASLILKC